MRQGSRIKWSNPENGVAPSHAPWCSSYWKGSLWVALDYRYQLYFLLYGVLLLFFVNLCGWYFIDSFKIIKLSVCKPLYQFHISLSDIQDWILEWLLTWLPFMILTTLWTCCIVFCFFLFIREIVICSCWHE